MIALSMSYAAVVGLLLVLASMCGERAAALGERARRWVWATALLLTLALPIVPPLRPASDPVLTIVATDSAESMTTGTLARWRVSAVDEWSSLVGARLQTFDLYNGWLTAAWLSTSLASAIWYVGGLVALTRRRSGWRRVVVQGKSVAVSAATGPAVVGFWTPEIVLPEWAMSLDPRSLDMVLRHESEHVRAGDHWLVHLTRFAVVVMPWNPAVWWSASRLRLAVEYDCDARVLAPRDGTAIDASAYAALLLAVAERPASATGVMSPALIESSRSLFRRIVAMCPADVRFPRVQALLALTGALVLCVAACGAPTPARQTPVEPTAVQSLEVGGPPPTVERPTSEVGGPPPPVERLPSTDVASPPAPSARPQVPVPSSGTNTPPSGQANQSSAAPIRVTAARAQAPAIVVVRRSVLRPGEGITNPIPIETPRPRYTPDAMRENLQGRVELEVVVEADGTVGDVVVVRSLDAQFGLDASAIDAARSWRFQPGTRDGHPVAVAVTLEMVFAIH